MNDSFNKFKKEILKGISGIPNVITEEWLINILKNNSYFRIWGFSFSDLKDKEFDKNISEDIIKRIPFSTETIFPEYHPFKINKNLLGVDDQIENLHNLGIDGKEINIAVIDYGFKTVHIEIEDNLISYNANGEKQIGFHGSVVSSLLVGKNIGISPSSKLYFFEMHCDINDDNVQVNETNSSLEKIYELNEKGANIRIVNISSSLHDDSKDFWVLYNKLKSQGCYVIDSKIFSRDFTSINKDYETNKYYYSNWQHKDIERYKSLIAIPTGGKSIPLAESHDGYIYNYNSTYSWAIPKLCGIFALSLQVNSNLTYDEFIEIVNETKIINEDGIMLINPTGILEKLENRKITI